MANNLKVGDIVTWTPRYREESRMPGFVALYGNGPFLVSGIGIKHSDYVSLAKPDGTPLPYPYDTEVWQGEWSMAWFVKNDFLTIAHATASRTEDDSL